MRQLAVKRSVWQLAVNLSEGCFRKGACPVVDGRAICVQEVPVMSWTSDDKLSDQEMAALARNAPPGQLKFGFTTCSLSMWLVAEVLCLALCVQWYFTLSMLCFCAGQEHGCR